MSSMVHDRFEFRAEKLVYGGSALGHHAGRPVLVPHLLPGERAQVETTRQARGMLYARPLQILEPAPERVAAPCPYFERCGGCHYQHLDAQRQVALKGDILRETLRRVGHIDWQGEIVEHAAEPWNYRNQVRLKIDPCGRIGFFAGESHDLVFIDLCPISSPRLNAIIEALAPSEASERMKGWSEVELRTDDRDQRVVMIFHGRRALEASDAALERMARECVGSLPGVVGVAFEVGESAAPNPRRAQRGETQALSPAMKSFGETALTYRVGDFDYRLSPGSFFQSSRLLLPEFVSAVVADLAPCAGLALDLYAGVGLFTLPLTRLFDQVVAVEANPAAAADLAANLRSREAGNARAARATAAEFLRRYAQNAPEFVVLDPPRAGCEAETLRRLAAIGPPQIRYASCDPPTLGRDLALLLRHGYAMERVELFDLFPQTFHIESLVRLRKN